MTANNLNCPANKSIAFTEGWDAAKAGVTVGDNPHGESVNGHWNWMNGWLGFRLARLALKKGFENAPQHADSAGRIHEPCTPGKSVRRQRSETADTI